MVDDVGSNLKTIKFFVQRFGCCMMLYSFGNVHATSNETLGPLVARQVPGVINIDMLRFMLR